MANLRRGSRFLEDYAEIVRRLCEANPDAADEFCEAIEQALKLLTLHPQIGAKAGYRHAPEVRKWVIQRFSNYLLFYKEETDGVLIIRLLHGAQDLPPLIGND